MATSDKGQVFEYRFDYFDANKDGRIDRSDFEQEANRLIHAFGADTESPRARAVMDGSLAVHDYIMRKAGSKSGSLSREEFIAVSTATVTDRGPAGFAEVLAPYAYACANLCDVDGSGEISQEEYARWLTVIGAPAENITESFRAMDTDKDGKVSIDEFVAAMKSYVLGESAVGMFG
ncbi:EF-hand domain-containing protein [Streptomyces sp. NPDC127108]|uniref:EF-hand domain-containing protein n=1 Tax=Streptomyces sp. NPDC127108 TaxID=3345361 RepID=UPI003642D75C